MTAKKKWKKPTEDRPHQCQFCGALFAQEKSLFSHICERKRRHFQRDDRWVRIAFNIFVKSYKLLGLAGNRTKPYTYDDFADSPYYNAYVRFARHIGDLQIPNQDQYVEWLVKNAKPLDEWTSLTAYEEYVRWVVETETAEVAVERNILFMETWGDERGVPFSDFFRAVSPGEILLLLKAGKVSPWLLFLSDSGQDLIARMSPEQQSLLDQAVAIDKWRRKFVTKREDVEWVKDICGKAGL